MRDKIVLAVALLCGFGVMTAAGMVVHSRAVAIGLGVVTAYFLWGELGDLVRDRKEDPPVDPAAPLLASPRVRRRILGVLAIGGASGVIMLQLLTGDIEVDGVRDWVRDLGPWGPILLITVLAVAMVIAPIPNPPFMIAAGIVWGTFMGVVYAVIGQLIGSAIIFAISRRFGRQFIPRLIGQTGADRVDSLARQMGPQLVFWWRMMPVSFDFAAYAAGLTTMSFRLYITLVFIGSIIPTTVVVAFGDSFGKSWEAQAVTFGMILVAITVPATVFYLRNRDSLPPMGELLRRLAGAEPEPQPVEGVIEVEIPRTDKDS